MITSKQRAYLRSMSNGLNAIFNIGKSGITPELTASVDDALEAREIVKIGVLDNCDIGPKEAAQIISERTHSDIVQVIGSKFVLYRASKKNKDKKAVIQLPNK